MDRNAEYTPDHSAREEAASQGRARARLLASLPVTERRLQLNDIPTSVLEGGSGFPVILLHGPGGYGAQWMRIIPKLVGTHRVIAPDLPGHGASGVSEGSLNADRVLGWLDDLIECTCETPPVLVGHVIGGAIAARYARGHGGRMSKLVLVDSLGLSDFQPAPEFGQALQAFMENPTDAAHDQLWEVCSRDLDALRDELGEGWQQLKEYNLESARKSTQGAAVHDLMQEFGFTAIPDEVLEQISVPTSLIWGRHDLATPVRVAEAASRRYAWPIRIIDDAADDPSIDQPKAFLKALYASIEDAHGDSSGEPR